MQGIGILSGGVVASIISYSYDQKYKLPTYEQNPAASIVPAFEYVWRVVLMFGVVPDVWCCSCCASLLWRMKMPETARYMALVAKNAKQAATDMSKVLQVEIEAEEKVKKLTESEFAKRCNLYLVGTTTTWFLLDIAFYSQNLFQKDIFRATGWIPPSKETNPIHEVYKIARAQTLYSAAACQAIGSPWNSSITWADS